MHPGTELNKNSDRDLLSGQALTRIKVRRNCRFSYVRVPPRLNSRRVAPWSVRGLGGRLRMLHLYLQSRFPPSLRRRALFARLDVLRLHVLRLHVVFSLAYQAASQCQLNTNGRMYQHVSRQRKRNSIKGQPGLVQCAQRSTG